MKVDQATSRQVLLCLFGVLAFGIAPVCAAEIPSLEKRIERLEQDLAKAKGREELTLGREIYKAACMTCHGIKGDGRAPSAKWLDPKPRDFTRGLFKWRTTPLGALPTDEDLERVVREGISGTDMVPFGEILSKKNRMAVVQYIKTFSPTFADPALWPTAETIVKIPEQRPFEPSEESVAKGKALYQAKGCVLCHGEKGDGKGPAGATLVDAWGRPISPWNFLHAYYKSGTTDQDLYRTITTGLNGTPMISYAPLTTEEERWQLVDYIRTFSSAHRSVSHYLFVDEPGGRVYGKRPSSTN